MKILNRIEKLRKERKIRRCRIAANIALKYGTLLQVTERQAAEFHEDGKYESIIGLKRVRPEHIKWYIRHKIEMDDPIWNGDFIAGMVLAGKMAWNKSWYPTCRWYGVPHILEVLKESPFYGKACKGTRDYYWKHAPALYLKSNKNTLSYMAGVLCTGKIRKRNKKIYIQYNKRCKVFFEKANIPIEKLGDSGSLLISPFWPALFTKFMPEFCKDYYSIPNRKKAAMAEEYASIFWVTHSNHNIVKDGLPFLPSRRSVFYKFKSDKGTLKELQKRRVEHNLVEIDERVLECVKLWVVENYKEWQYTQKYFEKHGRKESGPNGISVH